MPTIEERLAALETKLAALTDTTPTTYYEHQYSGEEIDNAVSRALPNGAIDQSVGTFVRPNLLDNWYFGRPVDQRGGYVVPGGTQIYSDTSFTDTSPGLTTDWRKVEYVNSTFCIYRGTDGTGLYYVKTADAVRGYMGNGYTVDRWMIDVQSINVVDNGLTLNNALDMFQRCEGNTMNRLLGRTVTLSLLTADNRLFYGTMTLPSDRKSGGEFVTAYTDANGALQCYIDGTDNSNIDQIFRIYTKTTVTIFAAKLELGPTQTLAHREGDRWVLNEVPDYGEQLRRCQRYCRVYKAGEYLPCLAYAENDGWYLSASMYIGNMRTTPINNLGSELSCSVSNIDGGTSIDKTITNWGIVGSTIQRLRISGGDKTPGPFPYNVMPKQDLIFSADL